MNARAWFGRVADHLRTSWWLTPSACVGGAVALSFLVELVDRAVEPTTNAWYLFQGGPEAAREVLSTIASSMMTFTGVVFSVTVLVLQLASSQFSPRVLRTFLKDRLSQLALGTFVGTFVFAVLGLRKARGAGETFDVHVPTFTVWLSVVLALVCVVTFIAFIHHIAQSIRVVVVIRRIGQDTRASLDRLYPEAIGEEADAEAIPEIERRATLEVPHAGSSGRVARMNVDALEEAACAGRVVVTALVRPGDFIAQGAPLFRVAGDARNVDLEALSRAVVVRRERDVTDDVAFGIRELVDIAERALSPGTNDPTTAVQVLDELHDILRRLARRRFPAPVRRADDGRVVLVLPRVSFDELVRLAVEEIRQYGASSIQVLRRLRELLEDVRVIAPPSRRGELDAQLALLDAAVDRGLDDPRDRRLARLVGAHR